MLGFTSFTPTYDAGEGHRNEDREMNAFSRPTTCPRKKAEGALQAETAGFPADFRPDLQRLVRKLQVYHVMLDLRNEELRRARKEAADVRRKYLDLYNFSPVGYFTIDVGTVITEVNPAGAVLVGVDSRQLIGRRFGDFLTGEHQKRFNSHYRKTVESGRRQECELQLVRSDGARVSVCVQSIARQSSTNDSREFLCAVTDITGRTPADEACRQAHEALECSTALAQTNRMLTAQTENRQRAESALREKATELEAQSASLAEANAALKVLLKQRDQDRRELEENVLANVNELVRPHLARLRGKNMGRKAKELLDVIESNLDDIISPLARKLVIEFTRLSPAETQIANLIRQGRSTKEIAAVMGLATCTIDFHRHNIRRKLGLRHKGINLATYLKAIG